MDPNRKINQFPDEDAAFLKECEQEFRNRYSVGDKEFADFIAKPVKPPPIVEPWSGKQCYHGDSSGNWNRNNYRPNNSNHFNRSNDNRSQRHNRPHYNHPYDRNYRRGSDYGSGQGSSSRDYVHGHGSSHSY